MTKKPRRIINPVAMGGGSISGGMASGNFTTAENLRIQFFAYASKKRAGKESGDAGYWNGGRCNWGGSHNLSEDTQSLANFFNSIASIDNDIHELKLSVNETAFNQKKQQLESKLQSCISKCQVTSSTSVASICIIWNDFFGSFLKRFLDNFQKKLQSQLNALVAIEPIHQKEVLELEAEIRGAEAKYNEAMANAAKETDPAKKAQFIAAAQEAEIKVRQAKQKLARNPLSKLSEYDYLNDLGRFVKGNLTSEPPTLLRNSSNSNHGGSSERNDNPSGGDSGWTSWGSGSSRNTTNQQFNQQQLLILTGLAILIIFHLYFQ